MSTNGKKGVEAVRPQKDFSFFFLRVSGIYFYMVYLFLVGFHICLRILYIFLYIYFYSIYFL